MKPSQRFLNACHREATDRPPVWLMRQAGRHLPEYQALREQHPLLAMMKNPDLVFEASLQPWRRYQTDAVIVFSDILILPNALGMDLEFIEGKGPRLTGEISRPFNPNNILFLTEGLRRLKMELKEKAALIGFAGAPWTVSKYISAAPSKKILERLAEETARYLSAQIAAGADVVQIFDSWGGTLTAQDYMEWSGNYICEIVAALHVPTILFVKESGHLLKEMKKTGAHVISVGADTPLPKARDLLKGRAIQGNLDPELLMNGSVAEIRNATQIMIEAMKDYPGYIANLGHGVLPETPVENVTTFVEAVRTPYLVKKGSI